MLVSFDDVLIMFYFYFFFFKQKTAYEMRISDWSSDVCSSDLLGLVSLPASELTAAVQALSTHSLRVGLTQDLFAAGEDGAGIAQALRWSSPAKIGRASCRERVCQYV